MRTYRWGNPEDLGSEYGYNLPYYRYIDAETAADTEVQVLDIDAFLENAEAEYDRVGREIGAPLGRQDLTDEVLRTMVQALRDPGVNILEYVEYYPATSLLTLDEQIPREDPRYAADFRGFWNLGDDTRQERSPFLGGLYPMDPEAESSKINIGALNVILGDLLALRNKATPHAVGGPDDPDVAILDVGIAFANARFRTPQAQGPDKTRFDLLWLQDRVWVGPPGESVGYPFGRGTVLLSRDIDLLLDRYWDPVSKSVDETAIYTNFSSRTRRAERDVLKHGAPHGTQVLDLLAGKDPMDRTPGEPSERARIFAVDMPSLVIADTSGASSFCDMVTGLGLVLLGSLSASFRPIVVNISLAYTNGPDTGDHPLARAMALLLKMATAYGLREVTAVVPSGNHLQDRLHAQLRGRQGWGDEGRRTLPWQIQPDDRTPSFVEIWLPGQAGHVVPKLSDLTVQLIPPDTEMPPPNPIPRPEVRQRYALEREVDGNAGAFEEVGSVYFLESGQGRMRSRRTVITLRPTYLHGTPDQAPIVAPAGKWELVLQQFRQDEGPSYSNPLVKIWIARDDTLTGFRSRGRQSHFEDECYRIFDKRGDFGLNDNPGSAIARLGTGSLLGTVRELGQPGLGLGTATVIVANSVETGFAQGRGPFARGLSRYRLGGRYGAGHRPDDPKCAVAEEGRSMGGPLAAGAGGGSAFPFSGTSAASAVRARAAADKNPDNVLRGYRKRRDW